MRENSMPFCKFGMQASEKTLQHFAHSTMAADVQAHFKAASTQSLATQAHIETQDTLSFDEYLAQWNNYKL
jgi:gamma-glutamylcysteine synthetase